MMTIELTEDHIELLKNGAEQFGRCSIIVPDENGDYVAISYNGFNHRRGRPPKRGRKVPGVNLADPPAAAAAGLAATGKKP